MLCIKHSKHGAGAGATHLDEQLPLGVVAGRDGVVQVLGGVAVVATSHRDGLILQEIFHACTAFMPQSAPCPTSLLAPSLPHLSACYEAPSISHCCILTPRPMSRWDTKQPGLHYN